MINKIIYAGIGVILAGATLVTGTYGLSERNKVLYETALGLEDQMMDSSFEGFRLSDYNIAFYDGNNDYVVTGNQNQYEITKRQPVLSTFVGTAWQVEDHYEVLVPTVEKMSQLFGMLNSAEQLSMMSASGELNFTQEEYGDEEHIATMWHEGFHAYQFTYYWDHIVEVLQGHTFSETDLNQGLVVAGVDQQPEVVALYEEGMQLLYQAVMSKDETEMKVYLESYLEVEALKAEVLSEELKILEAYYERVEGSAQYIEAMAYSKLYSVEAMADKYIENIPNFTGGSSKYYTIGLAKCLILDQLDANWKVGYDFSKDFNTLIMEQLGFFEWKEHTIVE